MKNIKHVGKMQNTGAKVLVVFRTLPGESDHALVLPVAQLPDAYHDSIMALVESEEAQQSFEFGEIMFTRMFPDGRPMLRGMQADGRLAKVPTDTVIMTPTTQANIPLSQLNALIAEQKNCSIDDLCSFVQGAPAEQRDTKKVDAVEKMIEPAKTAVDPARNPTNQPLSDSDLAKSLRSQADGLYKEAARLRKQADELDPPKKKTKVSETADV